MKSAPNQVAEEAFLRAFPAALVLTGSIRGAEESIENAIDSVRPDFTAEELLMEIVRVAVRRRKWQDNAPPIVPHELQALARLCSKVRNVFVSRVLLGFDPETCSEVLAMSPEEVDEALHQSFIDLGTGSRNDSQLQIEDLRRQSPVTSFARPEELSTAGKRLWHK